MITRSDAAGRLRVTIDPLRGSVARAVVIEDAVKTLPGVRAVHAYPRSASVVVWYSARRTEADAIVAEIERSASTTPLSGPARQPYSADVANAAILRMVVGGGALVLLGARRYVARRPPLLGPTSRTFATGVTIFTGYPFLRGASRTLMRGKGPGTDVLVSAATIASLILRENVVALTVLWLLNIGEYLQDLTLRRTRRAISELLSGTADQVWIVGADGAEVQVDIATVQVGDQVVIYDHTALPIDGVVVAGQAIVDQSMITGETLPVSLETGADVFAGTVVIQGRIVVRATAVGADTTVARIIERVEHANEDRAPIQTVGENFSKRFVPMSFGLSVVTFLATGDLRRAMTMLLIACPCAVGLSTPTAISAAIGNGARRGILIKGGSHLELAGRVDALVIDKTGTLTRGRHIVTNVVSFSDDWTPEQVLAYAASSEIHSRHPLAKAVIQSTEERHIEIPQHEECEVLLGLGMRTRADGRTLLLGNRALLVNEGVDVVPEADDWVATLQATGDTPLLLASDGILVGLISLRDAIRPEAAQALADIRASGVSRVVMLTGDHPTTAAAVAEALGITEWRAEVLPDDKLAAVAELKAAGHIVAMVGDGTNDAPALALADLGIAMGLAGTDVAVESADVALAGDDLRSVLVVRDLGGEAVQVIRQNYGMSISVNALGMVASALGLLTPVLAAILHNTSSLAVVANSARLVRYSQ
ncbi:heavy metal translocating P-type ATPase [Jongsikchunia kroppenstedtii]|uniref:heavy metal translocating P-type ATPase n=1 Tax=Jongsikchunia kroppenstedtii TaxID=1121721 RepID=UPI00037EC435|nr:cation-translocating P-type ATPase [Jongsikchunia kroppenstedtii]